MSTSILRLKGLTSDSGQTLLIIPEFHIPAGASGLAELGCVPNVLPIYQLRVLKKTQACKPHHLDVASGARVLLPKLVQFNSGNFDLEHFLSLNPAVRQPGWVAKVVNSKGGIHDLEFQKLYETIRRISGFLQA